jgi:nitric oxide synthase oxygenase domain/subunit
VWAGPPQKPTTTHTYHFEYSKKEPVSLLAI